MFSVRPLKCDFEICLVASDAAENEALNRIKNVSLCYVVLIMPCSAMLHIIFLQLFFFFPNQKVFNVENFVVR